MKVPDVGAVRVKVPDVLPIHGKVPDMPGIKAPDAPVTHAATPDAPVTHAATPDASQSHAKTSEGSLAHHPVTADASTTHNSSPDTTNAHTAKDGTQPNTDSSAKGEDALQNKTTHGEHPDVKHLDADSPTITHDPAVTGDAVLSPNGASPHDGITVINDRSAGVHELSDGPYQNDSGGRTDGYGEKDIIVEKYGPMNEGPLSERTQESFRSGSYAKIILGEDTTFYRVYGGKATEVGSYMTRTPQNGGMQSQMDLALNPEWGNSATSVVEVTVPKGTVIYEGFAAPQTINGGLGILPGGGNQVYITRSELNPLWFKK